MLKDVPNSDGCTSQTVKCQRLACPAAECKKLSSGLCGLCQVVADAWLSGFLTPFAAAARPQFVKGVDVDRLAVFCPFCARPLLARRALKCSFVCRHVAAGNWAVGMRRALSRCLGLRGWEVGGLLRTQELQARCFGAGCRKRLEENQKFQTGDFPTASWGSMDSKQGC
jgi:hypothetical protein